MRCFRITTGKAGRARVQNLMPEGEQRDHIQVLSEIIPVHPMVASMLGVVQAKGMDLYRKKDGGFTFLPPGMLGEDNEDQAIVLIQIEAFPDGIVVLSDDSAEENWVNEEGSLCTRFADLGPDVKQLIHDQQNIGAGGQSAFLLQLEVGASFRISLTGRGEGCSVHRVRWQQGRLNVVSHR